MSDDAGRDWSCYLRDFHSAQPGITEQVLRHARNEGRDPYDWLIEALPGEGRMLDLAGGNGAFTVRLPETATAVLLDTSPAELADAHRRGVRQVVRADATALPIAEASIDAVACSMALMLVPLGSALTEIRRVLEPGGLLVATVPATGPLTAGDVWHYTRLLLALRCTHLSYPNDRALAEPESLLSRAGLTVVDDQRRRFVCHIETPAVGRMLFDSLYLPDCAPRRLAAGRRVAEGWTGTHLGIPVRRLIART